MSEEVKEFVELTQDIVSKGLDRHLYLQEQEFLVRNLKIVTNVDWLDPTDIHRVVELGGTSTPGTDYL